jgi:hypothetical protein
MREDEGPTEAGSGATDWRAVVVELISTIRSQWRAVLLAIVVGLLALAVSQLLGSASDVAVVLAIVLGAALGVLLPALAERFRWRERTLAAIAAVLALLNLRKLRTWLAERISPSPPAGGSALAGATASVVAGVGAGVGLAVAGLTGAFSTDPEAPARKAIPSAAQPSRSAACAHEAQGLANTLSRRTSISRRYPTAAPVVDQICPDFDGDKLRDIAFTFAAGSGGAGVWAAFRAREGGGWRKVYESPGGLGLLISWRRPAIYIQGANAGCPWEESPCKFVWRDGRLRPSR